VVVAHVRMIQGRLNGGGTPIDLQTTNGGVRIKPRQKAEKAG
jgi:hypothetical protein